MPAVRRYHQLRRRAGRELRSAPAQVRGRRGPKVDDNINHSSTGHSDDFVVIGDVNTTKSAGDRVRPRHLPERERDGGEKQQNGQNLCQFYSFYVSAERPLAQRRPSGIKAESQKKKQLPDQSTDWLPA